MFKAKIFWTKLSLGQSKRILRFWFICGISIRKSFNVNMVVGYKTIPIHTPSQVGKQYVQNMVGRKQKQNTQSPFPFHLQVTNYVEQHQYNVEPHIKWMFKAKIFWTNLSLGQCKRILRFWFICGIAINKRYNIC